MGSGSWTECSYRDYSCSVGRTYDKDLGTFTANYTSTDQAFNVRRLHESLNPKGIMRECCDSKEHPESLPIILALDVTGSMGDTAIKIQKCLNPIMKELYETVKDVEICVMAIGDLAYDDAPIQMSQFESDIRIAENLDHVYFERGGGGNNYESYTAAWYMGLKHTRLDCSKRNKKGLIITMGDEPINPYLPVRTLTNATGDDLQADVDTGDLFKRVKDKFEIRHICVESDCYPNQRQCAKSFEEVIGPQNVFVSDVKGIHQKIVNIVKDFAESQKGGTMIVEAPVIKDGGNNKINENGEICW